VSCDTAISTRAFINYVSSLLEFTSPVWSPHQVGKIMQIERFTKRLLGLKDVLNRNRLEQIGQESLEMRRLRPDIVLTYTIIFGLVSDSCNKLLIMSNSSISTRGLVNISLPSELLNRGSVCQAITTLLRA